MDKIKVKQFFNLIFPTMKEGRFIEVRYKKPSIQGMAQRWAEGVPQLVDNLIEQIDKIKDWEMWFGTCPRVGQKGNKQAVKEAYTLWIDVDFKDFQRSQLEEALKNTEHQPHIIINSGHGLHLYWLIEPQEIKSQTDIDIIEGLNKGLAKRLGGDVTHDIVRIMRIPGTFNNKEKDKPVEVLIEKMDTRPRYKIAELMQYKIEMPPASTQPHVKPGEVKTEDVDLKKLRIPAWLQVLIINGWEQASRYRSRSEADAAVTTGLIRAGIAENLIYSIFLNPKYKISAKALEKGKSAQNYIDLNIASSLRFIDAVKNEWRDKVAKFQDFDAVQNTFDKWLYLEDRDYLKVVTATLITHRFESDPVWILLVAPPSGTKTSMLNPFMDLDNVHYIGSLTSKAFISGDSKGGEGSYLLSLPKDQHGNQNGIFVFKDFTTILQLSSDERAEILQQLREIWDGSYKKIFGKGRTKAERVKEWRGKITFLAGCTEFYEAFRQIDQTLGERYLLYKPSLRNRIAMTRKAVAQIGLRDKMAFELKTAVQEYFKTLDIPTDPTLITIPQELQERLYHLADLVTKARSSVKRDRNMNIEYIPGAEAPARFVIQLCLMLRALAIINKKTEVTEEEYRIGAKLAIMTIATDRYKIIKLLFQLKTKEEYGFKTTPEIAHAINYPTRTTLWLLENLSSYEVVERSENYREGNPYEWRITDEFFEAIKLADI